MAKLVRKCEMSLYADLTQIDPLERLYGILDQRYSGEQAQKNRVIADPAFNVLVMKFSCLS